ncbi:MlaC/ttg2D family ABC transporter substrate-binding protein [Marinospirillum perlucidum]|uniref:MlaC/ttg2D family ABC transporter substrate-binding protein n=1 Tax=Marinospirillum perlucidum TaxID=1982602 RepID=UPI000DF41662|nr:ABC transporter substrate-binding protein [Marinospirillum perlucidum]
MYRLLVVFLLFLLLPFNLHAEEESPAYQLVARGLDEVTEVFENNRDTYATDPEAFYQRLAASLEPYVDFRYISARVMGGRYFRAASPQQRSDFARVFQKTLVETFGQGLMNFDYQEFDLVYRPTPDRHENQDTVELEVVAEDGTRYPLVFTLRNKDDQWQIINLIVNGINLGLTFNSQFDQAMRDQQRDFDQVIANWSPDQALDDIDEGEAE